MIPCGARWRAARATTGEHKIVTIVFADISQFTELSEAMHTANRRGRDRIIVTE